MSVAAHRRVLLERDRELQAIASACESAAAGRGGVLAVRGTAGIGKTQLLVAACQRAESAGLAVCRASGSELERELAFGVVRQLFAPVVRTLGRAERAEVMDGAAGLAAPIVLDVAPPWPSAESAHAALHGLYWLAAGLAARRPSLVWSTMRIGRTRRRCAGWRIWHGGWTASPCC